MAKVISKKPSLEIVFSFRNEDDVLGELITRVRACLRPLVGKTLSSYRMIFVNDRSTDGSLDILRREKSAGKDLCVLTTSRRFGVSPCVIAGFQYSRADYVVYMDADLQDPPELIPEMLRQATDEGAQVVHTRRLKRRGEGWLKMRLTALGYFLLQKSTDGMIQPEVGDFKLIARKALNHILEQREQKPFLRGLITWIGFKQTTVAYEREARFSGDTKFPVLSWKVISNFLDSALISFSTIPLKGALFVGFAVSAGAFAYLLAVVIMKFMGMNLPGWSALMVTILFLGGIQLFTVGILGLYVGSIAEQIKGRSRIILDEILD